MKQGDAFRSPLIGEIGTHRFFYCIRMEKATLVYLPITSLFINNITG